MTLFDWPADSAATLLAGAQYAGLAFAGMLLSVIAYLISVARVRRSEPVLYLLAAWAAAALLMVAGRAVQHETTNAATVLLGSRISHTGIFLLVPIGLALAHELRGVPRGRTYCAFAAGVLALPYLFAITAYLVSRARRGRRELTFHERVSLNLFYFVLLPALLNDVLRYTGAIVTLEFTGAALFVHIMWINVGILARARDLFVGLEHTVAERTRELLGREEELSQMLASRRRILDAIPDVLCLLHDGRLDYVNDAGERFFGSPKAALTGSKFTDYVVPVRVADAERCLRLLEGSSQPTVPLRQFLETSSVRCVDKPPTRIEIEDAFAACLAVSRAAG